MILARDIIREVSLDLNDQEVGYEYTHWPSEQLKSYLFEALVQLSQQLHKLFTKRVVMKVEPGGVWQKACCECDQIVRVVGETNADGTKILHTLRRVDDNPDNEWPVDTARLCVPEPYEMDGYSISKVDDTYFQIMPPPPEGEDKYVMLECFQGVRSIEDDTQVLWRLYPIVKQWMLGRAYLVDQENNPAIAQLAKIHLDLYAQLFKTIVQDMKDEEEEKSIGSVRAVQNNATS